MTTDRVVQLAGVVRQLSAFNIGLAFAAAYFALRVLGPGELVLWLWTAVAVLFTLLSPLAGLTILAAIGPFTEALTADGRITAAPLLVATLGVSVVARLLVTRRPPRPSWPIALALVIFAGTALGVVHTWLGFGPERGRAAAELWVPGLGGAMTMLLAAAWLGWRGETRPLIVAVVSVALAALLSALDFVSRGYLQDTLVGPLLRSVDFWRLGGVIPAPNAAAAIFVVALAACLVTVVLGRHGALRVVAVLGAGVTLLALVLTYSRSGLLAVGVVLAAAVWTRWRRVGVVVTIATLLFAVGLSLWVGLLREIPIQADQDRLTAWTAAVRMWLAAPLFGAGFRTFEWLHADFGSATLTAPHNEWLRLLAEEGTVVGAAGVIFALLTPVALLRTPSLIAAAAGAAAAGLFVIASFNNPFLYTQVNVPAFAVIGTGLGIALRRQEDRARGAYTTVAPVSKNPPP